jgi:sulfur carrier protein ThiS
MPKVIIPPPYQGPTGGAGDVLVEGTSVRECLDAVETKFPGFGAQLFDDAGRLHKFVKVFRNGELVGREALDRAVEPGDQIEVLAAIAGG